MIPPGRPLINSFKLTHLRSPNRRFLFAHTHRVCEAQAFSRVQNSQPPLLSATVTVTYQESKFMSPIVISKMHFGLALACVAVVAEPALWPQPASVQLFGPTLSLDPKFFVFSTTSASALLARGIARYQKLTFLSAAPQWWPPQPVPAVALARVVLFVGTDSEALTLSTSEAYNFSLPSAGGEGSRRFPKWWVLWAALFLLTPPPWRTRPVSRTGARWWTRPDTFLHCPRCGRLSTGCRTRR